MSGWDDAPSVRALSILSAGTAAIASAVGAFVGGLASALLPGMPDDMGEVMGYLIGFYCCLGVPVVGVLGWPLAYGALRMARELQLEVPPKRLAVAIGLGFGLLMSLVPPAWLAVEFIRTYPG